MFLHQVGLICSWGLDVQYSRERHGVQSGQASGVRNRHDWVIESEPSNRFSVKLSAGQTSHVMRLVTQVFSNVKRTYKTNFFKTFVSGCFVFCFFADECEVKVRQLDWTSDDFLTGRILWFEKRFLIRIELFQPCRFSQRTEWHLSYTSCLDFQEQEVHPRVCVCVFWVLSSVSNDRDGNETQGTYYVNCVAINEKRWGLTESLSARVVFRRRFRIRLEPGRDIRPPRQHHGHHRSRRWALTITDRFLSCYNAECFSQVKFTYRVF